MTEAEIIANAIQGVLPTVKIGTLRFWGEWFGRPYDNWHKMVDVEAIGDMLHVSFNEGERLSVHAPAGLNLATNQFRIQNAERLHSYGHPKTPQNLHFMEFVKIANGVFGTSNGSWLRSFLRTQASQRWKSSDLKLCTLQVEEIVEPHPSGIAPPPLMG